MAFVEVTVQGVIYRLADTQVDSLRRLNRNVEKDESTLLPPGRFASLKKLGLAITFRSGLYKGRVSAYLTGLGAKVWAEMAREMVAREVNTNSNRPI